MHSVGIIGWRDLCASREYLLIFAFVVVLYSGEEIVQKSQDRAYTSTTDIQKRR